LHKHKDKVAAHIAMKKRWDTDHVYREKQRKTCKCRKRKNQTLITNRVLRGDLLLKNATQVAANKLVLSSRQRYSKRRGRLMASSKHRAKELLLQQKMSKQSNISAFDVSG